MSTVTLIMTEHIPTATTVRNLPGKQDNIKVSL